MAAAGLARACPLRLYPASVPPARVQVWAHSALLTVRAAVCACARSVLLPQGGRHAEMDAARFVPRNPRSRLCETHARVCASTALHGRACLHVRAHAHERGCSACCVAGVAGSPRMLRAKPRSRSRSDRPLLTLCCASSCHSGGWPRL